MKYIAKGASPQEFEDWKGLQNEDWIPTWNNFRNPEKSIVRESLLNEQGYICCYCGGRIRNNHTTEIEHLKPRSICTEHEKLNYGNLLASCNGGRLRNKASVELSCNARRGDNILNINPLESNCEERFLYTASGEIIPKVEGDREVSEAIDTLGLNIQRIKNRRKAVLKSYLFSTLTSEQVMGAIKKINQKYDEDGEEMFLEFSHVIINFLGEKYSIKELVGER